MRLATALGVTLMVAMVTHVRAGCTGIDQCVDCEDPPLQCYGCPPGYLLKGDGSKCVACEQNCKKCEFDNPLQLTWQKCLACTPGFVLKDGNCEACGTNCAVCEYKDGNTNQAPVCTDCAPSHKPTTSTDCAACPSHCVTCSATSCSKCMSGYLPSSADPNVCLTCPATCKTCSNAVKSGTTAVCTSCTDTAFLIDGTCQACTSNCKKCVETEAKCSECNTGFTLITSGICTFSCPPSSAFTGCTDCGTTTPSACETCAVGLGLKDKAHKSCDSCVANCAVCNDLTCGACAAGYVLDTSAATCKKCPANCAECELLSGVAHCKSGRCQGSRVKDGDGQCADCPQYCASCTWDATNQRASCRQGSCTNTGSTTQGATLDNNGDCQLCTHDQCKECVWNATDSVPHCTKCSLKYGLKDANTCTECEVCDYCSWNATVAHMDCRCSDLLPDPACSGSGAAMWRCQCAGAEYICPEGYAFQEDGAFNPNKDYSNCAACTDGNCAVCNSTLWCETCKPGSAGPSTEGVCVACPDHCDACTFSDAVQTLTACTNQQCETGYTNQQDGCINCGTGCNKCSWMASASSVSCITCDGAYAKHTSNSVAKCYRCDTGCKKCSYDGTTKTCSTCDVGYTPEGGVCQVCPANCKECEMNSGAVICSNDKCNHGFAEVDGACVACETHCTRCETSANSPAVCEDGYCVTGYGKLESGACGACPSHCSRCTLATVGSGKILVCDVCETSYGLNNNFCANCGPSCVQCEDSTDSPGSLQCKKCKPRFTLVANDCKACPSQCVDCSPGGTIGIQCNRCNAGYDLDANKQCATCASVTTVASCATCDRSMCLSCAYGYTISADKAKCLDSSGLEYCSLKEDRTNQCSRCEEGYLPHNNLQECRLFCLTCGVGADGSPAPDIACNDENRNHSSEMCPAVNGFYCGVARYKDTQEASRSCMNGTCDGFLEYETEHNGRKLTAKCCVTSNCNDEILDGIAGASGVRAAITLLILAVTLSTVITAAVPTSLRCAY